MLVIISYLVGMLIAFLTLIIGNIKNISPINKFSESYDILLILIWPAFFFALFLLWLKDN